MKVYVLTRRIELEYMLTNKEELIGIYKDKVFAEKIQKNFAKEQVRSCCADEKVEKWKSHEALGFFRYIRVGKVIYALREHDIIMEVKK